MKSKKSLCKFCKETGAKLSWVSDMVGFKGHSMYATLYSKRPFPKKYWYPLITLTKGAVSLNDLIEDYLQHAVEKLPCKAKITYLPEQDCWIVFVDDDKKKV